ncbi:hypothetical protein IAI10_10560 [Clostridium sp. 19966]|uniref:hypothetical protein n=1 Tax=Clostridium sp. 19966 TaxID=2768166 RepID=UPI0028DEA674|nr:hypothetical protein [Clostridium sp. 19966]MDT8717099.1 hypothetical protein [Clostridium sp. 19966]
MVNNLGYGGGYYPGCVGQSSNCICSLPTLIILILIILQFSKGHGCCHKHYDD